MKLPSKSVLKLVGWTSGGYAAVQGLRLVSNVVLARILAPELFGIMLIVNTVRTGIELVSDVGIGQNIVSNKDAERPIFYNTAWTLRVIRGLVLGLICAASAYPVSRFYEKPVLLEVMLAASLFFVFAGFESMGRYLVQKRLQVRRYFVFDVGTTVLMVAAHIVFALIFRDIWALVYGGLFSSLTFMIGTYFLVPELRHRFVISKDVTRQILSFGKWVFISSVVYFLAMNFDRLYMGKTLSLTIVGVYGIARSLSELLTQLVARFGNLIIFPMVAASAHSRPELRRRLASSRPQFVLAAALGVSLFTAGSDVLVGFLYDERYQTAAAMVPILCVGAWFSILSTMNEAILLGIGRPAHTAVANTAKLVWLLAALPLAVPAYGIAGAVCAIAASELVRYVPLWHSQRRERLSFARQDLLFTLCFFAMIGIWRSLFWAAGATSGFDILWQMPRSMIG